MLHTNRRHFKLRLVRLLTNNTHHPHPDTSALLDLRNGSIIYLPPLFSTSIPLFDRLNHLSSGHHVLYAPRLRNIVTDWAEDVINNGQPLLLEQAIKLTNPSNLRQLSKGLEPNDSLREETATQMLSPWRTREGHALCF